MANEGSTKPTYEELEAKLKKTSWMRGMISSQALTIRERNAELLRVRGLLQRLFNAAMTVVECPQGRVTAYMAEQLYLACEDAKSDLPTFPQSSSLTSQGAESADIGKLDSADKKHVCGQMGFNPSLGDTCAGCEARKVGVDKSGVEMAKNIPPDLAKNGDLKDGYCAGVFDAIAELDKEKP